MNKIFLSATAFLLSVNIVNATTVVKKEQKNYLSHIEQEQRNQVFFQKWMIKEKLVGKEIVKMIPRDNQITLNQIISSLPEELKNYHIRILTEEMAVTLEYTSERINININKENKIVKIYIG